MIPVFKSQNGYTSCIKIAGIPILPPLIDDQRRCELNEDKAKAIEIEKKIKRKRSSIDSGVMTGSYIDSFKNIETPTTDANTICQDALPNESAYKINDILPENIPNDSFLKSALEDLEFREFFYSAAERRFKDNNVLTEKIYSQNNSFKEICDDSKIFPSKINIDTEELTNEIQSINSEGLDEACNDDVNTSLADGTNNLHKLQEANRVPHAASETDDVKDTLFLPEQRIRRNSYTLDTPSPSLLEHMSRITTPSEQTTNNWQVLTQDRVDSIDLGFKTFTCTKKQRKLWHQQEGSDLTDGSINIPDFQVIYRTVNKSRSFVKTDDHCDDSNCTLPCSSQSSHRNLPNFACSSECIPSEFKATSSTNDNLECNSDSSLLVASNINDPPIHEFQGPTEQHKLSPDNENVQRSINDFEKANITHFPSENEQGVFTHTKETVEYSVEMLPGSDQIVTSYKSTDLRKLSQTDNVDSNQNHSDEMDDTISVSSSVSLSKFVPYDGNTSRPSTAEDLSTMLSDLQLKHERQIAELLNMQCKEKLMLSQLHSSNNGTVSTQSTANMSVSELSVDQDVYPISEPVEKRTQCSRELFPYLDLTNHLEKSESSSQIHISAIEKAAATRITAAARGYLTRRLLRTEKVQQLIDTIKESLNCAFSLQSETEIKKTDLELHERLAHQLTAALYELQSIISAPVRTRMAIISADREKLRKPASRPSSAISSATQKSILRRQKSMYESDKKRKVDSLNQVSRPRTKSLSLTGTTSRKKDSSTASTSKSCR